jgi:HSP20 family protein
MYFVPVARSQAVWPRSFDRLFDELFADAPRAAAPSIDVAETDSAFTFTLDVPGFTKEDVQIDVVGRQLTLKVEKRTADEKKDGDRVLYLERQRRSFSRRFTLPVELDAAAAQAKLEHGVLTLTLPKAAPRTAQRIAIN